MDHSNEITAQSAPNTNVNTPTMNPLAEKHSLDSDATRSMTNTSFADEKAMNNGNHYKNNGDVREPTIPEEDEFAQDVFTAHADGNDDHVDFRTMGWVQAGFVCLAEAIALGLLSFPSIFQRLGLVGGLIATILLACLAYITAWIYIDFKLRYMGCMNVADAGTIMFGRIGGIIFGVGIMVKSIGLAASHALAGEIALSNISDNAVCKIVFTVVVCIVSVLVSRLTHPTFFFSLPWLIPMFFREHPQLSLQRHFGKLTPMSIISVTCITVASFITIIGTGVQSPSVLVKNNVPIEWKVINYDATLSDVIGAMTNICFTFGTNMAVLTFCSEMKAPKDFRKSFVIVQGLQLFLYSLVGSLVYVFGGQYTTSPALTMTTRPLAIAAYSFALVTIIISGVVA
jgi:amino acid permease